MEKSRKQRPVVNCPYCGQPALLVDDTEIYGRTYGGKMWLCRGCTAWVGTHKGSKNHHPLGRLATAELRELKIQTHALFDPLWRAAIKHRGWSKNYARGKAYRWLAEKMEIPVAECHVGMFDETRARLAIRVLLKRESVRGEHQKD
jgi:endogenous inhibitor of DNA gyrase (YacG/DUF329 family)